MIKNNIQKILNQIGPSVTLVAVTKYASLDQMKEVIAAGLTDLGESKIQDLIEKKEIFQSPDLNWHFIGHLQTNKVKKAVLYADMIQSVDSVRLLELIEKECSLLNKKMPVLLQVNIAKEEKKFGFSCEEILQEENKIFSFEFIEIKGIMLIAPYLSDAQKLKFYFSETKKIYDLLNSRHGGFSILSMGMSHDFQTALDYGSSMVRIGSLIYNEKAFKT